MNLLDKSTRYYLTYSLFIFSVGSLFFYFSLQRVIYDGIDEALHQEKVVLIDNLRYEKLIDSLKMNGYIYIHTLGKKSQKTYDKYYVIYPNDQTHEKCRQLESVFKHDGIFYLLRIKQSLKKEEDLIHSIFPVGVVMFMILLAGVLAISNLISVRIWAPFYSIIERLRTYDIKVGDIIVYEKINIKEFDQLLHDLFLMTSKINEDYRSQKEFHENFSHELQTPLAIIQNNLEIMIQSPNLEEEEMSHVGAIMEAIKRISSLSKGLLLLSQIDNNQYPEVFPIDVVSISKKILSFFSGVIEDKQIVLNENYAGSIWIQANHALLDILMTNIISNSIRHNVVGGYINVEITNQKIVVSNSGKALTGDVATIFDRFVKLGDHKNSIGLGLPIVKKICEVYGFHVSYKNVDTEHMITIVF